MKITENIHDLQELRHDCNNSDLVVIPIPSDHTDHPQQQNIIGIYISVLNNMHKYYVSINHNEAVKNFTLEEIMGVINTPNKKYVYDIKNLPKEFTLKNVYCCNSLAYFNFSTNIIQEYTTAHTKLYSMYWNRKNINKIVPIYKHIEYCQNLEEKIKTLINSKDILFCDGYNKLKNYLLNLKKIECSGLYTEKSMEYCKYNPYTTTGRPSNTFNKVNYAALNKSDGTRNKYTSRYKNGSIIELDYDAYHLRIIADIINYKLPGTSIHEYLGKQYFGKEKLTKKEYSESKQISFQILYGGIPKEFLSIPFFSKVNDFILKFWQEWKLKNHYKTYLYNRKVKKSVIGEMNPQKLFNYYIQSAETELNSEAMIRVFDVLKDYNSKFILYTYDSFTFDFDMDDGKDLVLQIKQAMKYPTRISVGSNYGDLKDVSLKFS